MYNIDINFLNDRSDRAVTTGSRIAAPGDNRPFLIGAGVGAALLALTAGLWSVLQFQNSSLQSKQAELDGQLGTLTTRLKQVESLRQQTATITTETNAYASVFTQIHPWSAMFQDIRERTPEGVQIQSIAQSDAVATPTPGGAPPPVTPPGAKNTANNPPKPAPPPAPGASPSPTPTPVVSTPNITIAGVARSFGDVNDYILVLQKSRFLKAQSTKLLKAELTNSPIQIDLSKVKLEVGAVVNLPKVVSFQIQSSLTDVPANQLIADLNSNGAVGLVNRIDALRTKGVIQP